MIALAQTKKIIDLIIKLTIIGNVKEELCYGEF